MKLTRLATLTLVISAMICTASHAAVIYQHSFGGFGGALNGTAVDVGGQNWQSGPAFLDDGTVNRVIAASANGNAAFLPFTPTAGKIYTLSASILNNNSDWIAMGFMPTLPTSAQPWTATDFSVRHSNSGAYAWMFTRNNSTAADQQAFNGVNTSNAVAAINGDILSPASAIAMKIVLNTSSPTWTAEYFMNNTSYGTNNLAAAANTTIGGVGFSRDRIASGNNPGGAVSAFSLTVEDAVPEPAACMLAMAGILGVALLGRK